MEVIVSVFTQTPVDIHTPTGNARPPLVRRIARYATKKQLVATVLGVLVLAAIAAVVTTALSGATQSMKPEGGQIPMEKPLLVTLNDSGEVTLSPGGWYKIPTSLMGPERREAPTIYLLRAPSTGIRGSRCFPL
jgi:hypothetical protein